jgi:hypothetical protein
MGKSARVGLWICAAVLALVLVQAAVLVVFALLHQNQQEKLTFLTQTLPQFGAFVTLGLAFWQGRSDARWAGIVGLVLCGVLFISSAYWATTLEFPNAVSAEERVRMQEDCRREWPWWTAVGAFDVLGGGLLLLPPVGRFLHTRREQCRPKAEAKRDKK